MQLSLYTSKQKLWELKSFCGRERKTSSVCENNMLRGVFATDKDDASKQFRIPHDKGDST